MDGNIGAVYKVKGKGWFFQYHTDIIGPSTTMNEAITKGINFRKEHISWMKSKIHRADTDNLKQRQQQKEQNNNQYQILG